LSPAEPIPLAIKEKELLGTFRVKTPRANAKISLLHLIVMRFISEQINNCKIFLGIRES